MTATGRLVYPMTLDYMGHVEDEAWLVVRELVTNALDEDPGFTMGLKSGLVREGDSDDYEAKSILWIESKGNGLVEQHLLFGVSEKKSDNAIGQFGEGLKLALLVLTRMGKTAVIWSGGKRYWNEPDEMGGQEVFAVCWQDCTAFPGVTRIEIDDWEHESYEDRFLRPGDPRIIFTDPFGRSILAQNLPDIFVKGVWICKARLQGNGYQFGYNLQTTKLGRDREVVNHWSASNEICRIWFSVTDEELLVRLWQAVRDGSGERHLQVWNLDIKQPKAMRQAFKQVYGTNAVIATDDVSAGTAEYRGAKPVKKDEIGQSLASIVKPLIGTDKQYIKDMDGHNRVYVPDKELDDVRLGILKMLRRLTKRLGRTEKVKSYVLPERVAAERQNGELRIDISGLQNDQEAIECWLHEMAHGSGADDATPGMVDAVAKVAAEVIVSYARR
jgi:hypothetical protein